MSDPISRASCSYTLEKILLFSYIDGFD